MSFLLKAPADYECLDDLLADARHAVQRLSQPDFRMPSRALCDVAPGEWEGLLKVGLTCVPLKVFNRKQRAGLVARIAACAHGLAADSTRYALHVHSALSLFSPCAFLSAAGPADRLRSKRVLKVDVFGFFTTGLLVAEPIGHRAGGRSVGAQFDADAREFLAAFLLHSLAFASSVALNIDKCMQDIRYTHSACEAQVCAALRRVTVVGELGSGAERFAEPPLRWGMGNVEEWNHFLDKFLAMSEAKVLARREAIETRPWRYGAQLRKPDRRISGHDVVADFASPAVSSWSGLLAGFLLGVIAQHTRWSADAVPGTVLREVCRLLALARALLRPHTLLDAPAPPADGAVARWAEDVIRAVCGNAPATGVADAQPAPECARRGALPYTTPRKSWLAKFELERAAGGKG